MSSEEPHHQQQQEEEEEEKEVYDGGRWSMFSESGDDEVDEIIGASSTWEELFAAMDAAVHQEINDTAVRERMIEAFEEYNEPVETYVQFCARKRREYEDARSSSAEREEIQDQSES